MRNKPSPFVSNLSLLLLSCWGFTAVPRSLARVNRCLNEYWKPTKIWSVAKAMLMTIESMWYAHRYVAHKRYLQALIV